MPGLGVEPAADFLEMLAQHVGSQGLFMARGIDDHVLGQREPVTLALQLHGLRRSTPQVDGDNLVALAGAAVRKRQTHTTKWLSRRGASLAIPGVYTSAARCGAGSKPMQATWMVSAPDACQAGKTAQNRTDFGFTRAESRKGATCSTETLKSFRLTTKRSRTRANRSRCVHFCLSIPARQDSTLVQF